MSTAQRHQWSSVRRASLSLLVLTLPCLASAQATSAPRAHSAGSELYKVLAEGQQQRVIEATLKPGQQATAIAHPPGTVIYFITSCSLKVTTNGVEVHTYPEAGTARILPTTTIPTRLNVGKSDCRMLFVERD